jgi:hypothetical protein
MLESPGSAKIENGKVIYFKNKICGAISHEAYLAYFLMFLILQFFPQIAFSLCAKIYKQFLDKAVYILDR